METAGWGRACVTLEGPGEIYLEKKTATAHDGDRAVAYAGGRAVAYAGGLAVAYDGEIVS